MSAVITKRRVDDVCYLALCLLFALTVLFLLAPVLVSVAMAFDARTYLGPFPPSSLSLQWFFKFFSSDYLLEGLRTSVILASVSSLIAMVVGGLAAFGLERTRFRGRELVMSVFLAPLIVPGVILGFGLLLLFSSLGVLEGLPRLIAGHVLITFPFCLRATLASLVGIRTSLTEAAMSLGANEWQALWEITFPLARTGVLAGGIFAFAVSMDDVAVALFLADPTTYTLPIALVSLMRANFDLTIAAASLVLLVVSALSTWLLAYCVDLGQGVYRTQ
jgi:putative spermidine/putrescine transport system permease protein